MRSSLLLLLALVAAGCGPLPRPLPDRLGDNAEKEIDVAWNAALTLVNKYDRRRWLDALVGTQAYQSGVDRLTLRSEKAFAGGRVVMEVFFDRSKPDDDRFVVTVFDPAGAVARQERYSRDDVERTARELFDPGQPGRPNAATQERWKEITEMLPKQPDAAR